MNVSAVIFFILRLLLTLIVVGGVAWVLIRHVVDKAPPSVPEWIRWAARVVIILLAIVVFLAFMGWTHVPTGR